MLSCLKVIVKESEKYRNELEWPCTPDIADDAESLQVHQIESSSRDLWEQLKALKMTLKA